MSYIAPYHVTRIFPKTTQKKNLRITGSFKMMKAFNALFWVIVRKLWKTQGNKNEKEKSVLIYY